MRVKRVLRSIDVPFSFETQEVLIGADALIIEGSVFELGYFTLLVSVPERTSLINRLVWMVRDGYEILATAQDAQYVGSFEDGKIVVAVFVETQEQAILRTASLKK